MVVTLVDGSYLLGILFGGKRGDVRRRISGGHWGRFTRAF